MGGSPILPEKPAATAVTLAEKKKEEEEETHEREKEEGGREGGRYAEGESSPFHPSSSLLQTPHLVFFPSSLTVPVRSLPSLPLAGAEEAPHSASPG